jgi:hypothetical protein
MQRRRDEKRSMGKLGPLLVLTIPCYTALGIVVCEPRRARRLTAPRGPVATPLRIAAGESDGGLKLLNVMFLCLDRPRQ